MNIKRIPVIAICILAMGLLFSCGSAVEGAWIDADTTAETQYWISFDSDFMTTESDGHFEFLTLSETENTLVQNVDSYYFGSYSLDKNTKTITLDALVVSYGERAGDGVYDNVWASQEAYEAGEDAEGRLETPLSDFDGSVFKKYIWFLTDDEFTFSYEKSGQNLLVTLEDGTVLTCGKRSDEQKLEISRALEAAE